MARAADGAAVVEVLAVEPALTISTFPRKRAPSSIPICGVRMLPWTRLPGPRCTLSPALMFPCTDPSMVIRAGFDVRLNLPVGPDRQAGATEAEFALEFAINI